VIDEKLRVVIPREFSGSDVYNRYQYQVFFAAGLIIKMMSEETSFLTFLDYLDDVVVVSGNDDNKMITFYQVKTKNNGPISMRVIITNNWISKMHYNISNFSEFDSKGILVTNNGIKLNDKIYDQVNVEKLSDLLNLPDNIKFHDQVVEQLSIEYQLEKEDIKLDNYYVLSSDLSLKGYDDQIRGKLSLYCQSINNKLTLSSLDTIYSKLILELQKRQKNVFNPVNIEVEHLKQSKSITDKDISLIIEKTWLVELPEFQNLNDFKCNVLGSCFTYGNNYNCLKKYKKFQIEKIKSGSKLVSYANEKIAEYVDINQDIDEKDIVQSIINYLNDDDILKTSEFYKEYGEFIVTIYLYKMN